MTTSNFTSTLLLNESASHVFDAINDVRGWWQGNINGSADKLHDVFTYEMPGHHSSTQEVVALIPNERVVWLVTDSNLKNFANPSEWTGTKIIFEISTAGNQTKVVFTHEGLVPAFACYGGCAGGWELLIQRSLFSFITTGKGVNVFG